MNSFVELAGAFFHGLLQSVLLWIPVLEPFPEPDNPPLWWYRCWGWFDWFSNRDSNKRPTQTLMDLYWSCIWMHVSDLTRKVAEGVSDLLRSVIMGLLGSVRYGWSTFSGWIDNIQRFIGFALPFWAYNIVGGLNVLYGWLPSDIKLGIRSWAQIWEWIIGQAIAWAQSRYEQARLWIITVWSWYNSARINIEAWWNNFSTWLAQLASNPLGVIVSILGTTWQFLVNFRNNAASMVIGWLGPTWQSLATFARDCLTFYYNLWGAYQTLLAGFLQDPLGFIGDRLEQIFIDRW